MMSKCESIAPIKSVAILGAGAVGSYVYWGLSNRKDIDLCIIAKDERKSRLETNGLTINDVHYSPIVKSPKEAHGVDLLIICTKAGSLAAALPDIKEVVGENTTVISLLNGVDSEDIIAEAIGMEHIVHSLVKVASRYENGSYRFDPETSIGLIYGDLNSQYGHSRTDSLNALFENTGLYYRATDYIIEEIWSKFRLNVSNNQPQAMVGCGVGAYQDSEHVAFIRQKLIDELEAIAKVKGIDMSVCDPSSARGSKVSKGIHYSTLQDLDAGRHTEVDIFAGAIMKMGKELGIPTPYNEFTYHMIKALEEKNDGLFDY